MQFFNFIFLARSWAADRLYLSSQLSWLGQRAEEQDIPLAFILYPEGTLVSKNTRPISKKFADKMGIPDMVHTLLPRSTGLHYSLRSLVPRMPKLKVIDITVAYPGTSIVIDRCSVCRPCFRYPTSQVRPIILHVALDILRPSFPTSCAHAFQVL